MNTPPNMDEHIADRCVAGLRNEHTVSDEDAKALKDAILENIRLTREDASQDELQASVNLMAEITNRIKGK